jgi:diguanylate cyclase (GGDEF)-like protein
VQLNAIRRAFDSGILTFANPPDPHQYQQLSLAPADYKKQRAASDDAIREYIIHKAYWLGFRAGVVSDRLHLRFDLDLDADYLGVTVNDISRNVWLLGEQGLLRKTQFPGASNPTARLIEEYESKLVVTDSKPDEPRTPTKSGQMDEVLSIFRRDQLDADLISSASESNVEFPLSLLMIDLDGFKAVNDTHGHLVGDEVLKAIAGEIKSVCRGKGEVYRFGGDEFVVLLPNHSLAEASATANRIGDAVRATSFPKCPDQITASIGVASHPETVENPSSLLEQADNAMYEIKNSGRDGVRNASNREMLGTQIPTTGGARKKRDEIIIKLSGFIVEGAELRNNWRARLGQAESLQKESAEAIPAWHKKIESYLKTIPRGDVYAARFQSAMKSSGSYPVGISLRLAGTWDLLMSDLAELNEFIRETDLGKP